MEGFLLRTGWGQPLLPADEAGNLVVAPFCPFRSCPLYAAETVLAILPISDTRDFGIARLQLPTQSLRRAGEER